MRATTRLTFTVTPCPSRIAGPVTAEASPGAITFTNPEGNPPADILWGDENSEDPDGEELLDPGESVTVQTKRTHVVWIALNAMALPTDDLGGWETVEPSTGATTRHGWAQRWSRSPLASGPAGIRELLSPGLADTPGAVIVIDPTDIDPDELAELRELELAMADLVLGTGELDVPQVVTSEPTGTGTATASPTTSVLARTGSSDVRPLAGLSLGLVLAGAGLIVAASGRVRVRRH